MSWDQALLVPGVDAANSASLDLTDLVAYWKLSGLTDSSGNGHTLTNNNTATFVSGKVGNCVNLASASNQSLGLADHASFSFSGDWTIGCWVYLTTNGTNTAVIAKASGFSAANYEWALLINSSNQVVSAISNGSGDSFMAGTTFGALSTGTWYFVVQRYDATNDLNRLRINATDQSVTWTGGSHNTTRDVQIGAGWVATLNGRVDDTFIFNRHLTDDELAYIYNSGTGRELP